MIPLRPLTPTRRPPDRSPWFGRLWRWLLPIAIGVMVLAVTGGIADTSSRPAWTFGAGVVVALFGVASLFSHLFDLGRREVRDLEKRLEDRLDDKGRGRP